MQRVSFCAVPPFSLFLLSLLAPDFRQPLRALSHITRCSRDTAAVSAFFRRGRRPLTILFPLPAPSPFLPSFVPLSSSITPVRLRHDIGPLADCTRSLAASPSPSSFNQRAPLLPRLSKSNQRASSLLRRPLRLAHSLLFSLLLTLLTTLKTVEMPSLFRSLFAFLSLATLSLAARIEYNASPSSSVSPCDRTDSLPIHRRTEQRRNSSAGTFLNSRPPSSDSYFSEESEFGSGCCGGGTEGSGTCSLLRSE
jgi:hypothetical protein